MPGKTVFECASCGANFALTLARAKQLDYVTCPACEDQFHFDDDDDLLEDDEDGDDDEADSSADDTAGFGDELAAQKTAGKPDDGSNANGEEDGEDSENAGRLTMGKRAVFLGLEGDLIQGEDPADRTRIARPRPPMLYELYRSPPEPRAESGRQYLSKDQRRYIAYRLIEGETCRAISARIGVPEATVRSLKRRLRENAALFFDCDVMIRIEVGFDRRQRLWFCRYCGDIWKTMPFAGKHAREHLLLT